MTTAPLILVGSGSMAIAYAHVLKALGVIFQVVGRSPESVEKFTRVTGVAAQSGGVEKWLEDTCALPRKVIVAVGVEDLATVTRKLIAFGCPSVLVEKPGGLTTAEIRKISDIASGVNVFIAYNRRWYASTRHALDIITMDGGVTSFTFDFTEWKHKPFFRDTKREVMQNWLLVNSSHVIDLAFFLGGFPLHMTSWKDDDVYVGAGITSRGTLFSYHANWDAPGRWGVEIMTRRHKLIFRPLEELLIQEHDDLSVRQAEIPDASIDSDFKPGIYRQVEAFVNDEGTENFLTLQEQVDNLMVYETIANGTTNNFKAKQ